MSTARLDKLKTLLDRVQARKGQPRLRALPGAPAIAAALAAQAPQPEPSAARASLHPERVSKPPVSTPLEAAMAGLSQPAPAARAEAKAAPAAAPVPARKPPSDELFLDAFEPEPATGPAPMLDAAPPRPAPAAAPALAPPPPAPTPVLSAPSARIDAPALADASDSVVRAVSPARVEAPKSFGELLELSLSLRPR